MWRGSGEVVRNKFFTVHCECRIQGIAVRNKKHQVAFWQAQGSLADHFTNVEFVYSGLAYLLQTTMVVLHGDDYLEQAIITLPGDRRRHPSIRRRLQPCL